MLKEANHKKKILLVDDDRSVTDMLSMLLETRGYDVAVANTGEQALQKVNRSIDLILLDIILPDLEGFQVCRKLKENEEISNTSIIILTGKLLTQDIVEGLYLGADDYLTKPFEYEELVARMEAVMRRRLPVGSSQIDEFPAEREIVMELRDIIDGELVVPYFQPIFLLNPLEVYGFESLARPQSESILKSPEILFKVAIQYGMYQDLELVVWKKALKYASSHINGKKLFLNCNPYLVEGLEFTSVKSLFDANAVDIHNVFLEITERSAITDFKSFFENLEVYRKNGFKFAVDDVGGGYASLESIIETRPEVVKIDRHIVSQLTKDDLRCSIVKFIVSFCKEHKIFSVAEGIETKEELEIVKYLGVDAGQGYYLHGPVPYINTSRMIMDKINKY